MAALIEIILPVFLVIGFGYFAAWRGFFSEEAIDGVMNFAQNFAIPCLLFLAISKIDLQDFHIPLMLSYYGGAFAGYLLGYLGARYFFKRSVQDSIAIGFCVLYPNSLMLGLPITERAYGADALAANFAIISIHAPLLYTFGVVAMELARARDARNVAPDGPGLLRRIVLSLVTNPLVIGISLGFVVNVTNFSIPGTLDSAVSLMARAALPAALFGLGGVLARYKPAGDMKAIGWVTALSLLMHPAITYALAKWGFQLDQAELRSAVLTAAMAPGVNTYIFANMYCSAKRVVASSVLIGTAVSIVSIFMWLAILP